MVDGQIVLSAYTPTHWARLCEVLGRPEMITDSRFAPNEARIANRTAMRAAISTALGDRGTEEAVEIFAAQGIVAGANVASARSCKGKIPEGCDRFPPQTRGLPGDIATPPLPTASAAHPGRLRVRFRRCGSTPGTCLSVSVHARGAGGTGRRRDGLPGAIAVPRRDFSACEGVGWGTLEHHGKCQVGVELAQLLRGIPSVESVPTDDVDAQ